MYTLIESEEEKGLKIKMIPINAVIVKKILSLFIGFYIKGLLHYIWDIKWNGVLLVMYYIGSLRYLLEDGEQQRPEQMYLKQ